MGHPRRQAALLVGGHGVGGEADDRDGAGGAGQAADRLGGGDAVHLGHHDVHQHEVEAAALDRLDGLAAVLHRLDPVAHALEHAGGDQAVGRVVLGDQDAVRGDGDCFGGRRLADGIAARQGQQDVEMEDAAGARRAFDADGAAHAFDQAAADRQAEAAAAEAAGDRAVDLGELGEQLAQCFRGDADAGVGDREAEPDGRALGADQPDRQAHRAGGGELDAVAEQVEQHLAQAVGVADGADGDVVGDLDGHRQALGGGFGGHQLDRIAHNFAHVEGGFLKVEAAGVQAGEIQDVVDKLEQVLAGIEDDADIVALGFGQRHVLQQAGDADDAVHRGADLVAHHRQEFAAGAAGGFGGVTGGGEGALVAAALGDVGEGAHGAAIRQMLGAHLQHHAARPCALEIGVLAGEIAGFQEAQHAGVNAARGAELAVVDLPLDDVAEGRVHLHQVGRQVEQADRALVHHRHLAFGIDHHDALADVLQGGGQRLLRAKQALVLAQHQGADGDHHQRHQHAGADELQPVAAEAGEDVGGFDADDHRQGIAAQPAPAADAVGVVDAADAAEGALGLGTAGDRHCLAAAIGLADGTRQRRHARPYHPVGTDHQHHRLADVQRLGEAHQLLGGDGGDDRPRVGGVGARRVGAGDPAHDVDGPAPGGAAAHRLAEQEAVFAGGTQPGQLAVGQFHPAGGADAAGAHHAVAVEQGQLDLAPAQHRAAAEGDEIEGGGIAQVALAQEQQALVDRLEAALEVLGEAIGGVARLLDGVKTGLAILAQQMDVDAAPGQADRHADQDGERIGRAPRATPPRRGGVRWRGGLLARALSGGYGSGRYGSGVRHQRCPEKPSCVTQPYPSHIAPGQRNPRHGGPQGKCTRAGWSRIALNPLTDKSFCFFFQKEVLPKSSFLKKRTKKLLSVWARL